MESTICQVKGDETLFKLLFVIFLPPSLFSPPSPFFRFEIFDMSKKMTFSKSDRYMNFPSSMPSPARTPHLPFSHNLYFRSFPPLPILHYRKKKLMALNN